MGFNKDDPGWKALFRVAALCNRAEFKQGQESVPVLKREVNGDASEAALLKCCELSQPNIVEYRDSIQLNSDRLFNWIFNLVLYNFCGKICIEQDGFWSL